MLSNLDKTNYKLSILKYFDSVKGQKHIQGQNDCNMIFMDLHEPQLAKKMRGNYKSIREGCVLAKKLTGYASVRTFLKYNNDYEEIKPFCDVAGDVVVFNKSHDVYISCGKNWFGYLGEEQILGVAFKRDYKNYKIYRKVI